MKSAHVHSAIGRSMVRPALTAAACLVAALAAASSPALAQCVAVNGALITNYDIEQRAKFNMVSNDRQQPRKEIIEELIDDKLKVQAARRDKIDLTDKDVDQQYADLARRMHLTPGQLTQALNEGGIDATTLKAKILADISWRYIVESQQKGAQAEVGYDYTLRPILFLAPGGNAALMEARRKDADALRARFASCEAGLTEARAQHDVIIREPITKNSSDLAPALREILNKTEVGHLTPPEMTLRGVELFALCDKKETDPETAEKRINQGYLSRLRRRAKIKFLPGCLIPLALTLDEPAEMDAPGPRAPAP
jgi:peptidyl-prolyl cis-trans isomerase SurA